MNQLLLNSSGSMEKSLRAIRQGHAGLDKHRTQMITRIPNTGDWARFPHNSITINDLAYLCAFTGHEFALLRGKNEDILFHGGRMQCAFNGVLYELLIRNSVELVAHSHSGEEIPVASAEDRTTLALIG